MQRTLIRAFDQLADAPGGVPKLRELILQLAVQGQLVMQLAGDETASEMLARLGQETKPLRSAADDIPPGWEPWRLVDLLRIQYGFAFDSTQFNDHRDGKPLIRIRDLNQTDTSVYFGGEFPPEYLVEPGAYLVGMDGDFNIFRWRGPVGLLNQRVCRLRDFSPALNADFVFYAIREHLAEIHRTTS